MEKTNTVEKQYFYMPSGYSRKKVKEMVKLRKLHENEIYNLRNGEKLWFVDKDNCVRQCRVYSKPKRWKRNPDRVEYSFKYGMYEVVRLNEKEIPKLIFKEVDD